MKDLVSRLKIIKKLLVTLNVRTYSRTNLEQAILKQSENATHATYEGTLRFLMKTGCITKVAAEHRAHWSITEKGKVFLTGLNALDTEP